MRVYDLHYWDEPERLATWTIPDTWTPKIGSVLTVPFQGKLRNMRVIGGTPKELESENSKIILDFLE